MIEGALKADGRIAAKNAVKIRAALHQVTDFKRVFDKYQETQPQPTDNTAQDRTRARSWLILNVYLNDEPLRQTVMRAWAEAYVLGQAAADEWIKKTKETNKADDIEVNWDNWKPGDKATALLLNPTKGFEAYLQSTGGASYFKKFNKETIVNLGTALSDSIALGLDAESAAVMIGQHVASPSRALTIAITEQNRAMSFGSIERYKEAGLQKMEWAVSDPCDICAKNDGQVIVIGQTFASGDQQPPAHPHCRCVLLPVIPGMEDDPMGIDGGITAPTIDDGVLVNEPVSTEYRGYHTAPRRADEFGSPATDIEEMMPDFYARPNIYTTGMDQADRESVAAILAIRNKPEELVTIYRAVPKDVKQINAGDWVTLSPSYANSHLLSNLEEGHVIKKKIPARDLWFDGDSINEFGYDPVEVPKVVAKAEYVKAKNSFDYFTPDKAESFYAVSKDGQINYNSYNVKGQNLYLKNLLEEQGFNGKPQIVSAKEFKKYVDEGATPIYRGIAGDTAEDVNGYVSQLLEGDAPFIGKGMFGDGTYFASNREIAEAFTKETVTGEARNTGRVVEAVLNPQAKVITLQELRILEDQKWPGGHGDYPQDFYEDPGAVAAALGYDAIKMERPKLSWTPDAKPIDADYIVVLNRTALIFKETP